MLAAIVNLQSDRPAQWLHGRSHSTTQYKALSLVLSKCATAIIATPWLLGITANEVDMADWLFAGDVEALPVRT